MVRLSDRVAALAVEEEAITARIIALLAQEEAITVRINALTAVEHAITARVLEYRQAPQPNGGLDVIAHLPAVAGFIYIPPPPRNINDNAEVIN